MNDSMTIQRIIEIRAERSTDTVKDLKQEISDLKDALLNVEEGTKDYDKGVQLLQEDQRRLNEVNKLTKKENVALATSYYDLNAQLVQARKDYKNLTAEQRDNAEVGGALLTKIQDLDRQLKDLENAADDATWATTAEHSRTSAVCCPSSRRVRVPP